MAPARSFTGVLYVVVTDKGGHGPAFGCAWWKWPFSYLSRLLRGSVRRARGWPGYRSSSCCGSWPAPEVPHDVRRRRPATTGPTASDAEYPPCLHGHALSGSSESSDLPRPGLLTLWVRAAF